MIAWPLAVGAQSPPYGILDPGLAELFEAFYAGMREISYTEGKNVTYMRRSAAGRAEAIPQLAAELVQEKVDVIVTGGPLD